MLRSWRDDNSVKMNVKPQLPFRDPEDPRVLYKLSPRARRISLRIRPSDREVSVSLPSAQSIPKAMAFVRQKSDWIQVQLESLPPPQPFVSGGTILFRGKAYQLHCPATRGRPFIDHDNQTLIVPSPEDMLANRTRRLLIREARTALEAATHHYAKQLGRSVAKISVRDTASRWGSCITRQGAGHISYSWRLICAPDYVLDYVAAHECAHMVEDNHSAAYWAVVAKIVPDYKRAKQWLNKNGALLHAVGAHY